MMILQKITPEELNAMNKNTLMETLGIEIIDVGEDFIKAKMPVDHRTVQPFGLLHGGASVSLAESLGSIGALLSLNNPAKSCVGIEINANHVKSVSQGSVIGTAKPVHIGKGTQIWEIRIENDKNQLVCISRITLAVIDK